MTATSLEALPTAGGLSGHKDTLGSQNASLIASVLLCPSSFCLLRHLQSFTSSPPTDSHGLSLSSLRSSALPPGTPSELPLEKHFVLAELREVGRAAKWGGAVLI